MSASMASSTATLRSSSVSLSQPSSWTTVPTVNPSLAAGPPSVVAGACWEVPPPAVELTVASLPVSGLVGPIVLGGISPPELARLCNPTQALAGGGSAARAPTRRRVSRAGPACNHDEVSPETNSSRPVIHEGLPTQLPDIDPEETQEWVESFDSMVDQRGRERARYVMLRLLERAREQQ